MSKVWKLILGAVFTLVLGLSINAHADQTLEGGTDRPGHDLQRIEIEPGTIAGASICQGFCARLGTCTSWTFVRSGVQGPKAQCYLKFGVGTAVPNNCCQSGVVARRAEANIDRPGMDFLKLSVTGNPPECKSDCDRDARCVSWTFVVRKGPSGLGFCFLKNGVPDAVDNDCCTSGVKGAPPGL